MIKPEECKSYNEYHKKSGLSNEEASSNWMDFKLKLKQYEEHRANNRD